MNLRKDHYRKAYAGCGTPFGSEWHCWGQRWRSTLAPGPWDGELDLRRALDSGAGASLRGICPHLAALPKALDSGAGARLADALGPLFCKKSQGSHWSPKLRWRSAGRLSVRTSESDRACSGPATVKSLFCGSLHRALPPECRTLVQLGQHEGCLHLAAQPRRSTLALVQWQVDALGPLIP